VTKEITSQRNNWQKIIVGLFKFFTNYHHS